jgi:hypothetical protein
MKGPIKSEGGCVSNLSNNKFVKFIFVIVDNPITVSLSFALWVIPIQFWLHENTGELLQKDSVITQQFIEWFGVPYGLLLALVLVYIWTQFDSLDVEFDREADSIYSLYVTLSLVVHPSLTGIKDEIITNIRSYVSHVVQNYSIEWKEDKKSIKATGYTILGDIRSAIGDLIHGNENEVITTTLLSLANELSDVRGDRLSRSKQRIRKPMLTLSIISSLLWISPFIILDFNNFILGTVLTGGTAFVVASLLQVIYDLDEPFSGTWAINIESWSDLLERIN